MYYHSELDCYCMSDNMRFKNNYSDIELDSLIEYYQDLLNYLEENNNILPSGVYTSEGYDAVGPISGCNYYYDTQLFNIACGTYCSNGKEYNISNFEKIRITKYLKKLINEKQRRKNINKLVRIFK